MTARDHMPTDGPHDTIGDVLRRDPRHEQLPNNGQARLVGPGGDDAAARALRGELATFVCDGHFGGGLLDILESYLRRLGESGQQGVWVSGFFGSGKSHLLKMLTHLWVDTELPGGATARNLVPELPANVKAALRELDAAAARGAGPVPRVAAAGSLLGGTDSARRGILGVLLPACGLPAELPAARLMLLLADEGALAAVREDLGGDRPFRRALTRMHTSGELHASFASRVSSFGGDADAARDAIRVQFPAGTSKTDLTSDEFLDLVRRALLHRGGGEKLPCTLLVLDEVQQWVGDSERRSGDVTEAIEVLSKETDARVLTVAAGQEALTQVPKLGKLKDRCPLTVSLSDADVTAVTRKVLLAKKPAARDAVDRLLAGHRGTIEGQLAGTTLGHRPGDADVATDDYPLLPVRRRFWEACFRALDSTGTRSQLRGQLKMLHEVLERMAGDPLGRVIPADELYTTLEGNLRTDGVLPREIAETIITVARGDGLKGRVCRAAFLIGRLPKKPVDPGVRADARHIADLLTTDLAADPAALRAAAAAALEELADDGTLMKVDGEYRLQTAAGAEWESAFKLERARLAESPAEVDRRRAAVLTDALKRVFSEAKVLHGAAKESRPLYLHRSEDPPPASHARGGTIPVWVRDGWSAGADGAKDHAAAASAAAPGGPDGATVFLFVPTPGNDGGQLKKAVLDDAAAEAVLTKRGDFGTGGPGDDGREARRGMQTRRDAAREKIADLVGAAVGNARVLNAGGEEPPGAGAADRLRAAGHAASARLFPKFPAADHDAAAWKKAGDRAAKGDPKPLAAVGHDGEAHAHPVCRAVLDEIGRGNNGRSLLGTFEKPPYGWPTDAVRAALTALAASGHVTVSLNGKPADPGLSLTNLKKADFRREKATVGAKDRIALRKLFAGAGIDFKPEREAADAETFLEKLDRLAAAAGGEPPLPPRPTDETLDAVRAAAGNERLLALAADADHFAQLAKEWSAAAGRAADRRGGWETAVRLADAVRTLASADLPPDAADPAGSLTDLDAVRIHRQLLADTDPVPGVAKALAGVLRAAATAAHARQAAAVADALASLDAHPDWSAAPEADRTAALAAAGLADPPAPKVATDEQLLADFATHPPARRRAEADAAPARADAALKTVLKAAEPTVREVRVDRRTLRTEADLDAWLAELRDALAPKLADGPVLPR